METERKSLRLGLMVIAGAVLVRLLCGGGLELARELLRREVTVALLLYLETGRVVRPAPAQQSVPTTTPQSVQQPAPLLTPEDAALVEVSNHTDLTADVQQLLLAARFPDLTGSQPTVLIVHSHGSESYQAQAAWVEISPYRTLDVRYNMVSVGEAVVQRLAQAGITALHDTTLHDQPDYAAAYANSRQAVKDYLTRYPSIRLVLDLHRDASSNYVNQLSTAATVSGQPSAQLMMVVGTSHSQWQQNMSTAVQLHALLEKADPGLCRPINFRSGSFNQDLLPCSLLVEVGAAGDDHSEALVAANALADAIIALGTPGGEAD